MNPIDTLIDSYLEGIPEAANAKAVIYGMFAIAEAKSTVEALYALKGTQPEFQESLRTYFAGQISSLSDADQQRLTTILTSANSQSLQDILRTFTTQLSPEQQDQIKSNIQKMKQSQNAESVSIPSNGVSN